jgi:MoaA/NifB/PqqE/SkfB family radical SAM enzyme
MREIERWASLLKSPRTFWHMLFSRRYRFSFDLMPIEIRHMSWKQRSNLAMYGLNLIYRRAFPWSWPIHMQIELTNYCNLKCPICPTGQKSLNRPPTAIDVHLFESLLNEVGPYLLTLALYAWGEPLLHPQLSSILEIAGKYNIATILSTNGQNLDDDRVLNALLNSPTTYLIVAIDGLTDETNSQFRVGARLDPILRGVRQLATRKKNTGSAFPIIHMRYLVMNHNQHEYSAIKAFAVEHMFDFLSIRTLSPIDSPVTPYSEYLPQLNKFKAYQYNGDLRIRRHDFICMHAFSYPTVFSNGCVVSCEQDFNAQQPYGMLSDTLSFKDVWFGKPALQIRQNIRDNPSQYSFCLNCPFADRPISSCSIEAHDLRKHNPSNIIPLHGKIP